MPMLLPKLDDKYTPVRSTIGEALIDHLWISFDSGEHPIVLGCDPGQRNGGMAIVAPNFVSLYQITFPSTTDTVERISTTLNVMARLLQSRILHSPSFIERAVVEQAAYNMPYGQAGLAEVRSALVVGLLMMNVKHIEVLPPATWRKRTFGSGKIKAETYWPNIPKDAASALGIAFSGLFNPKDAEK